jgi:hypothetical protein
MPFDPAAITSPFRMQPGLRRVAPGTPAVHAAPPGSPEFQAKLAALAHDADQCLVGSAEVDARPALRAIAEAAGRDCPQALMLRGDRLVSAALGLVVDVETGELFALPAGLADLPAEVTTSSRWAAKSGDTSKATPSRAARANEADCAASPHASAHERLSTLPPAQRAAALASLTLREDFALIDAASVSLPWMAVCLPSHWDPSEKAGLGFAAVHAPVADSDNVRAAGAHLLALVSGEQRWERFVWTLTPWPGLDQHPARHPTPAWPGEAQADAAAVLDLATLRTERQGFIPLPGRRQTVFTIEVQARPLRQALADEGVDPVTLAGALASMSDAVLAYRNLTSARERLCAGLTALAAAQPAPAAPPTCP